MQRRLLTTATVAGVNGDMFSWAEGRPSGMLMMNTVLAHAPSPDRSSTGIGPDGSIFVNRVRMAGTWRGDRSAATARPQPRARARRCRAVHAALRRSDAGARGERRADAAAVRRRAAEPRSLRRRRADEAGRRHADSARRRRSRRPRHAGASRLATEAPLGSTIVVRLTLTPDWSQVVDAVGGGPVLVREGTTGLPRQRAVHDRAARAAPAAQRRRADRRRADHPRHRRRQASRLQRRHDELRAGADDDRLGAVSASALDGGGSATMAFEGDLLNRPSDPGGERAVAESLNIHYYGVQASEPAEAVISPNGDGVAERQTLTYKIVRPSTVVAKLVGRTARSRCSTAAQSRRSARTACRGPVPARRGVWRFVVSATDDLGRASTMERTFSLNNTLGACAWTRRRSRRAARCGRPSRSRGRRRCGRGSRPMRRRRRHARAAPLQAGAQTAAWRVRLRPGRYQVRITAQNAVGTVTSSAAFSVRRARR